MKLSQDAYGQLLLAQHNSQTAAAEIFERDDGYIDTGSAPGLYFHNYKEWSPIERAAIKLAKGRVLDVGCGAGRHSLYLQQKGFEVTGIDNSPGAIRVCKLRGLKKALVRPVTENDKFKAGSFDTVIMFGNNFGLLGSLKGAKVILKKLERVTSADAKIIAGTRNPHKTSDSNHLQYHRWNQKRGRMPGQIRMRARFGKAIGEWFDYLFVAPEEMNYVLDGTNWHVEKFIAPEQVNYFAVIGKRLP